MRLYLYCACFKALWCHFIEWLLKNNNLVTVILCLALYYSSCWWTKLAGVFYIRLDLQKFLLVSTAETKLQISSPINRPDLFNADSISSQLLIGCYWIFFRWLDGSCQDYYLSVTWNDLRMRIHVSSSNDEVMSNLNFSCKNSFPFSTKSSVLIRVLNRMDTQIWYNDSTFSQAVSSTDLFHDILCCSGWRCRN